MNAANIESPQCPVCDSHNLEIFIEINQVPVHCHLLRADRKAALEAPKGDIRLAFCRSCSHIFNQAFDPGLMQYSEDYENSLFFSPRFRTYVETLAKRLVERYQLYDKDIIEIGSGKGDFLRLLSKLGNNRGLGFDPGYRPEPDNVGESNSVTFISDVYSAKYADHRADLICSRHTLEHVFHPVDFLNSVYRAIKSWLDTVVFFEVPNVLFTLRDMGIWDIIYEHYSYFSSCSLSYLFNRCGFHIREIAEAYDGQFLTIESFPAQASLVEMPEWESQLGGIKQSVVGFGDHYRIKLIEWRKSLNAWRREGRQIVIWGAGSKGVSFLNTLKVFDEISYVVDINPRKQGMYIAGTGQEIIPPDSLITLQPDIVILMNPIYMNEIQAQVEDLGLSPVFYTA